MPNEVDPRIAKVKAILHPDVYEDSLIQLYLDLAKDEILNWGFSETEEYRNGTLIDVPARYQTVQVMSVVVGLDQQGAEGESNHSENGIVRTFNQDSMIAYIHKHVIPYARLY